MKSIFKVHLLLSFTIGRMWERWTHSINRLMTLLINLTTAKPFHWPIIAHLFVSWMYPGFRISFMSDLMMHTFLIKSNITSVFKLERRYFKRIILIFKHKVASFTCSGTHRIKLCLGRYAKDAPKPARWFPANLTPNYDPIFLI